MDLRAKASEGFQHQGHVLRYGRFKAHPLTCVGMEEGELPSVEHVPIDRGKDVGFSRRKFLPSSFPSICDVSHHRMTHGCAVDSDLVGSSGLQVNVQERNTQEPFFCLPTGFCGPTVAAPCGHLLPIGRVAAYGQVDDPCRCLGLAENKGQIPLFYLALLKLETETFVGHVILCHHQGPRRILIKAVDDAWPELAPNALQIWTMVKHRIYKGSTLVSRARMNHNAGGLVQDDDVRIFVKDRQGDWFRLG